MNDIAYYIFLWGMGLFTGFCFGSGPIAPPSEPSMQVITDSGTGCQYVSYKRGGLYPRLDVGGNQVCSSK